MKTLIILLALLALCSAVYADAPLFVAHQVIARPHVAKASTDGASFEDYGPSGIRFGYLHAAGLNTLAIGLPLYAIGNFHADPVFTVLDHVRVGTVLGYDWHPIKGKDIVLCPYLGSLIQPKPFTFGGTIKVGF